MAAWKRQAIQKVIGFSTLPLNWDSHGSEAPRRDVTTTAIDFLLNIPAETLPAPLVVPTSGGGFHIEWSIADRELEISIEPDCRIDALRVEHGVPVESDPFDDLSAIFASFAWLAAR
jgi:hypothetical protein